MNKYGFKSCKYWGAHDDAFQRIKVFVCCRDLGEYLRKCVTEAFKHGEASAVNEEECQRIYSSLNRIASGTYVAK